MRKQRRGTNTLLAPEVASLLLLLPGLVFPLQQVPGRGESLGGLSHPESSELAASPVPHPRSRGAVAPAKGRGEWQRSHLPRKKAGVPAEGMSWQWEGCLAPGAGLGGGGLA